MKLKIINAEYGIASCSRGQVPLNIWQPSTVVFFYYPKRDWIVFNEEHEDYQLFLELIQGYAGLNDRQRKKFIEQVDIEQVCKVFNVLNYIFRIRRKLYRSIKRKVAFT